MRRPSSSLPRLISRWLPAALLLAGCAGRQAGIVPPAQSVAANVGPRTHGVPMSGGSLPGIVLIPGLQGPMLLTSDLAGNEWVAAGYPPMLARVNEASYQISETILPSPNRDPFGIALGRHHTSMWFTRSELDVVGYVRLSTGAIHQYSVPHHSYPGYITAGPDNAMWFTEAGKIGRIELAHFTISEFAIPGGANGGITLGPDNALWFAETDSDRIGRITTSHHISEFHLRHRACPLGITAGPDGGVWFTESSCGDDVGRIGRIDPTTHAIHEWPVPTTQPFLWNIVSRDSDLWFTENFANKIGHINAQTHAIHEYALPGNTRVDGLSRGSDDELWFTQDSDDAGKLCPELPTDECAPAPL